MNEDSRKVEAHYDAYPYPGTPTVFHPLPVDFKRCELNFLLRRRANPIRRDARIWIAGCGTHQAAHWGLCFPHGRILATDMSSRVLEIARDAVTGLRLENVTFEQHDLMTTGRKAEFDLVIATGVIHHLPDPAAGLVNIRNALADGGAVSLMVYNRMHRQPVDHFRRLLSLFNPDDMSGPGRLESAVELLRAQLDSPTCAVPGRDILADLAQRYPDQPAFVADVLLNPLEHSYDIPRLLSLLDDSGFRHVSWTYPGQWRADAYLEAPDPIARIEALDPASRWDAIYHLAGHAAPSLDLLIEPQESADRPAWSDAELMDAPLLCAHGIQQFTKGADGMARTGTQPAYQITDEGLSGKARAGFGISQQWTLPREVGPVFDACDGTRTIRDIAREFSSAWQQDDLLELIRHMLPDRLGLLTTVLD